MSDSETTVASLPFVITRLDRVIHMVKVQLNRVYRGTSMLLLTLNAQFTPQRTRTAWIPRSNHVATFYVALVHTGNDGIEKKVNDFGRDFILTTSASQSRVRMVEAA